MPRKPSTKREPKPKKESKIKQAQQQTQQVIVNIADVRPKRKPRKTAPKKTKIATVDFPKTIYQPVYIHEDQSRYNNLIPSGTTATTSILQPNPKKTTMPILEDLGTIGTEGFTEILDRPTKRETLEELITPVYAEPKSTERMGGMRRSSSFQFPEGKKEQKITESINIFEPTPEESQPSFRMQDPTEEREIAILRQTSQPKTRAIFSEETGGYTVKLNEREASQVKKATQKLQARTKELQQKADVLSERVQMGEEDIEGRQTREEDLFIRSVSQTPRTPRPRKDSKKDLVIRYNILLNQTGKDLAEITETDIRIPIRDFKQEVERLERMDKGDQINELLAREGLTRGLTF